MKYSQLKNEIDRKTRKDDEFELKHYKKSKLKSDFKLSKKSYFIGAGLGVVFFVGIFLFWVVSGIEPFVKQKIEIWVERSKGRNFEVNFFEYGSFHFSRQGIVFKQVRARGITRYDYPYFQPRQFEMDIPILQIYFKGSFREGLGVGLHIHGLDVRGGNVLPEMEDSPRRLESISELNFQAWIPIGRALWKWKKQAIAWGRQLRGWVFNGAHMTDVHMSGNATFATDGVTTRVYFASSKERNRATYLEGDMNDLRKIAHAIEPKFTEEDLRIASKNFLKTPRLLHVRTLAEAKAEALYQFGSEISYDTFRHVFWSYYLTQTFGADFARRVTDAHETGDASNTARESEKDRRNNALGIEYARRKLSEQDVAKIILSDPRILQNQIA